MWDIWKKRLQLLVSVDEQLGAYKEGTDISAGYWEDMMSALRTFELPDENIMFGLIEKIRDGDIANDVFIELRKYFNRFFDAQASAAAASSKIGEDYRNSKYGSDSEFSLYIEMIRSSSLRDIAAGILDRLRSVSRENPEYYKLITEHSHCWYHEGLWLDGIGGENNSLIINRAATLKNNVDRIEWLYENLSDAISRRSLNAIINFWLTWDNSDWLEIAVRSNDVVDTAVYPFYDDEVFVDCGSYIGDTVMQYINTVNKDFARVYTYDISSDSIEEIKKTLAFLPNVDIRHKGTGDVNCEMNMVGVDQAFHGNKLSSADGAAPVEKVSVVRIDDDIREPVSFIKIDCEGMDKETLRGAHGHICKYHPKLHVDSYHKLGDIVDVPTLIRGIDPSYTLYLRIPQNKGVQPRFPVPAYMAV